MRAIVLLNCGAGERGAPSEASATVEAEQAEKIGAALAEVGIEAEVRPTPGERLMEAAEQAVAERPDAIVAAGGDGTISAVAAAVAGSGVPLGVLPMGTLNHFARDLGLPLDLREAAQVVAAGNVAEIDVGQVNERVFVNNSSIGLYPQVVRHRERIREELGHGKWRAMLRAIVAAWRRHQNMDLRLAADRETVWRRTPFVFVGNNQYQLEASSLGRRETLKGGELCLYYAEKAGRFRLLKMALRALIGRLHRAPDLGSACSKAIEISARKKQLAVAIDGEVIRMRPPLRYRIWEGALKVLGPAR